MACGCKQKTAQPVQQTPQVTPILVPTQEQVVKITTALQQVDANQQNGNGQ